jgi:hypothetical protein
MWHVGIHVWEVPSDVLEPNYDEYYAVRTIICLQASRILNFAGQYVIQSP